MDTILARAAPPGILPADKKDGTKPDKKAALRIISNMKNKRRKYEYRWKEIRDYELPFLGDFYSAGEDFDKADRRDLRISNGVAWLANQAFAAGVMSGLTPPSKPWFKLSFSNGMQDVEAQRVLERREKVLQYYLHKSNFYNVIHSVYLELPFGQAPIGVFSSAQTGLRFMTYPIGSYYLGASSTGLINQFARVIRMNANQIVEQFGDKDLPAAVNEALKNNSDTVFDIVWLVLPNDKRISGNAGRTNMPYVSLYWIDGNNEKEFLYVGGYEEFPVPVARYLVNGIEPYASGPGWYAEGDAKALQVMKKDLLTACELMVKPPMKGPPNPMNMQGINLTPGGYTEVNEMGGSQAITPLFQVPTNPQWLAQEIVKYEDSIKRTYSADLFLMLDAMNQRQMTAREVIERQQEKLQQLGPVVERMQDEFLSPIIERSYNILERMGAFDIKGQPDIPDELAMRIADEDVKVEYISPLAQAQKISGLTAIEQAVAFVSQMAQLFPDVLKSVDPMGTVTEYFNLLGAPGAIQRTPEEIEALIQQEQQAAEEQKQMAEMQQMAQAAAPAAQAAKNLTEAARDGNPAVNALLGGTV